MAHVLVGVVTGGTEGDRRGARLGEAARGFGIVGSDAEMAGCHKSAISREGATTSGGIEARMATRTPGVVEGEGA